MKWRFLLSTVATLAFIGLTGCTEKTVEALNKKHQADAKEVSESAYKMRKN